MLWFGFVDFRGGLFSFSVCLFGLGFGQGHLLLLTWKSTICYLDSKLQSSPCVCLPSSEMTSPWYHTRLILPGSRDWTRVLLLAWQALYQLSASIFNCMLLSDLDLLSILLPCNHRLKRLGFFSGMLFPRMPLSGFPEVTTSQTTHRT